MRVSHPWSLAVVAIATFVGHIGCTRSPASAPPDVAPAASTPPIEAPKDGDAIDDGDPRMAVRFSDAGDIADDGDPRMEDRFSDAGDIADESDEDTEGTPPVARIAITYDHEAVERRQEEALRVLKNSERVGGGLPMIRAGGMPVKLDVSTRPVDAIGATSRCSEWAMGCFRHEAEKRGLKGMASMEVLGECVRAAPRCRSKEPWKEARACCAEKCVALFEEGLAEGMKPIEAWTDAITKKRCMPGVIDF